MESTGTKPASRIQSRPLSSSTITPSTPKQAKRPHTQPAPILYDSSQSTPKPSAARQKLHDLFRIPLGRKSSRSRSRSRPSSPRASLDIPPLPISDETTPRARRSSSPQVFRQPSPSPTPTPTPRLLRVTNATPSLASTAPSLKIPKFFSCKSCIKQNKAQSFHLLLFNSTQYIDL